MIRDPVCGMIVDPEKSNWVANHNGEEYYFCSEKCQRKFAIHPQKFIEKSPMKHQHAVHGGHSGGCCGAGRGRGWTRYINLAIMVMFLTLLLLRR